MLAFINNSANLTHVVEGKLVAEPWNQVRLGCLSDFCKRITSATLILAGWLISLGIGQQWADLPTALAPDFMDSKFRSSGKCLPFPKRQLYTWKLNC
jgi:hypothetical protein